MSEVLLAQLQAGKPPKPAKFLTALRELTLPLSQDTEGTSFTPVFALALAGLLPQLRDTDNDSRKVARLVYFFITEIVARHREAKNVAARLLEAAHDDLNAATYFPRQLIAIQSLGVLSTYYYSQYGLSVVMQQEKVYRATLELVRKSNVELQRLPFTLLRGGGSEASSKQKKELLESLALSGALTLMIRQVLAAKKSESGPPDWMAYLYTVCFAAGSSEVNDDGARAGHAALLDLALKSESARTEIAVHLYSNKKLIPPAAIPDALACVSYLRLCACIAFSTTAGGSHVVREAFFRVLLEGAVSEKRLPVSLEAITLLYQPSHQQGMRAEFKRMLDVASVTRLLCQALQQKGALPTTIHAVLHSTLVVAKWLVRHQEEEEEHAAANLSLTLLAAGGGAHRVHAGTLKQLRETVLNKSAQLESRQLLSVPLRLVVLRALVWLVPSFPPPTFTSNSSTNKLFSSSSTSRMFAALSLSATINLSSTGGGGAARAAAIPLPAGTSPEANLWQGLEGRLREAPAHLTDAQLALLLAEGRERLEVQAVSSSSAATRQTLVPLLLGTAFNYVVAVPSDNISEAVFKVWESSLKLLSAQPVLQAEVLVAIFQVLDYGPCPEQGNSSNASSLSPAAAAVVRHLTVWEAQGQARPPTTAQRRAACIRLVRIACWFLGEHALNFPADRLGAIIFRMQTLGMYSDCFTRSAALGALCKIAVCCESLDVKMALYEYLHGLEKADFDINIEREAPAALDRSSPSLGVAAAALEKQQQQQHQQRQGQEQRQQALLASFDAGCGGGLKEDNVAATLVHLREVFREQLRSMGINPPPVDGGEEAVPMDTSLFVVRDGQGN